MKWLFKTFFKALRVILGPVLLLQERLATPKGLVRSSGAQQAVDMQCRNLALYQFKTCPFCIKVRQEIRRLSLNIERLDAQPEGRNRDELVAGGGQAKVPCLRITDAAGKSEWLYESGQIIEYLRTRFSTT